jgi:hypothetical protein
MNEPEAERSQWVWFVMALGAMMVYRDGPPAINDRALRPYDPRDAAMVMGPNLDHWCSRRRQNDIPAVDACR